MNKQIQLRLVTFLAVFVLGDIAAQEDMPRAQCCCVL